MKITSFQLTIQQGVDEQGYSDNFYISIDEKGLTSISRPYKSIPIEEQLAIEEVITSAIKAHIKLVKQVDNANKDLMLEEYRPLESVIDSASEVTAESAVSQSSHGTCSNNLDCTNAVEHSRIEDAPFEETETGSDKA